jgi:hypothetical protein
MKRLYLMSNIFCLIIFFIFSGCGDGPGSPGSKGSEETGIEPMILSITHSSPPGDQGDLWDIDLIPTLCITGEIEEWGNDSANITFYGDPLNPNVSSENILYVTNYRVTFLKKDPSFPTIEQINSGNQAGIYIMPGQDIGPFAFMIFDMNRKEKIVQDLLSGIYDIDVNITLIYDMKIEMWGQDKYGNDFEVGEIIRTISIADYDNC